MCDCAAREPIYIDMGTYWLVEVICNKCGKVLNSWTEPKEDK